jgi:hypothetical protein
MNSNQATPNPLPNDDAPQMNDAITKKLKSYRWKGRMLTGIALSAGLLSIAAGILLMWANSAFLFPQVQLLVQQAGTIQPGNTNSIPQTNSTDAVLTLSDGKTMDRQVLVTLMLGKAMYVTSRAVALLGAGTFFTLLLVIFNRYVTLRQINASLLQISNQIKDLQNGKSPGAR